MTVHFSNFNHRLIASISLILLGGFLAYYLRSTYLSEEKDFNKEVRYIFTNAFRTAESKTLDKMIFELKGVSWLGKENSTNITVRNHKTEILTIDSVGLDKKSGGKATTIVIARNEVSDENPTEMRFKMDVRNDSIQLDSTYHLNSEKIGSNFTEIEKLFKENLQNSGLNIEYKIVKDSNSMDSMGSDVYKDVFTNEFYSIQTDQNQMFILKRILPEIVISILMYLVFIFAFVSIISSSRKQKELYTLQQDFVRNMTHELKTPIATMGVALEAIQNFHAGQDESVRQEYYRIAESENHKLNMLVDKVLSASQQMDAIGSKNERVNLNKLVADVLESFKWRAEQNGISVILKSLRQRRK
ncbi:MAG: HAMP domain-containing histidine kinase [Saprospiraceae bacterium]|nr:HAMP domain-containing histidine kinase [Saprospiraceae bacterium]